MAGDFLHLEPGFLQSALDHAGTGEGGKGRLPVREPRHLAEKCGLPHVRIFGRRKTIEKPGINTGMQLGQHLAGIADQQGQRDASLLECQPVYASGQAVVLLDQLRSEGLELRPDAQGLLQVGGAQRVFFATDEVQPGMAGCLLQPLLPGTEKIQPGTEAGFGDGEVTALQSRPAFFQPVVMDKDMTGFCQAVVARKIDVVVLLRERQAVLPAYFRRGGGRVG